MEYSYSLPKANSVEEIKIGGFNHAVFHRRGDEAQEMEVFSLSNTAPEVLQGLPTRFSGELEIQGTCR
jgi:hypothetical protein